jgi:hypothetical protein
MATKMNAMTIAIASQNATARVALSGVSKSVGYHFADKSERLNIKLLIYRRNKKDIFHQKTQENARKLFFVLSLKYCLADSKGIISAVCGLSHVAPPTVYLFFLLFFQKQVDYSKKK